MLATPEVPRLSFSPVHLLLNWVLHQLSYYESMLCPMQYYSYSSRVLKRPFRFRNVQCNLHLLARLQRQIVDYVPHIKYFTLQFSQKPMDKCVIKKKIASHPDTQGSALSRSHSLGLDLQQVSPPTSCWINTPPRRQGLENPVSISPSQGLLLLLMANGDDVIKMAT